MDFRIRSIRQEESLVLTLYIRVEYLLTYGIYRSRRPLLEIDLTSCLFLFGYESLPSLVIVKYSDLLHTTLHSVNNFYRHLFHFRSCISYTIKRKWCLNDLLWGRRRSLIKIQHRILIDCTTIHTVFISRKRTVSRSRSGNIHLTKAKHQPVGTDVRNFLFDRFHHTQGGAGTFIIDAAQGGRGQSDEVSEYLLSHVLRLHDLSNSILHISY